MNSFIKLILTTVNILSSIHTSSFPLKLFSEKCLCYALRNERLNIKFEYTRGIIKFQKLYLSLLRGQ